MYLLVSVYAKGCIGTLMTLYDINLSLAKPTSSNIYRLHYTADIFHKVTHWPHLFLAKVISRLDHLVLPSLSRMAKLDTVSVIKWQ